MKPKESTYQVVLDALALTTCYPALLITAEVPIIYMHQFWATITKHKASYRFKIDNKRFSVNVDIFREILNISPKVLGKAFDEPPTEDEALSFIRELGHTREIKYITYVIINHLHQPWRTFASIIKDLAYQIDNIDSKKQDKMFYPRFTKMIIHHFLRKGAEPLKPKKGQKKSDSAISSKESPSKKKSAKAKKVIVTKPKPTKKKAPVKAHRGKGLNVLSEVALSKADQLKEAIERSKKDSHTSYLSGSSIDEGTKEDDDDDDDDSKNVSDDSDDYDDDGDNDANDDDSDEKRIKSNRYENPNLNQSDEEHKEEDEEYVDERIDEEDDDEVTKELYKDVNVNLGNRDADMTDADHGRADQQNVSQESGFEKVEEDAHVTLTLVLDTQKTDGTMQSSSVSSDFTSKLLNLENPSPSENEIASLMDTIVRHEEQGSRTSSLYTIPIMAVPEITSISTTTIL
ncbi:hypothetical protein Tco_0735048 [Tanacetum coccineum]